MSPSLSTKLIPYYFTAVVYIKRTPLRCIGCSCCLCRSRSPGIQNSECRKTCHLSQRCLALRDVPSRALCFVTPHITCPPCPPPPQAFSLSHRAFCCSSRSGKVWCSLSHHTTPHGCTLSHLGVPGDDSSLRVRRLEAQQLRQGRRAVPGDGLTHDGHGRRLSEHQLGREHRLAGILVPLAESADMWQPDTHRRRQWMIGVVEGMVAETWDSESAVGLIA